jgi:O-succinylhomoserine sulfhydrylase
MVYSRYSKPNNRVCGEKCARWKGQLLVLSLLLRNGLRTIFNDGCIIKIRRSYRSSSSVFGATHSLFVNYSKWNIQTSYFDINEPETIESFIIRYYKDSFAESPTNPAVDIIDLELLGNIAKSTI